MAVSEVKKGLWAVGAIDWDRRLFDELIPLPDGTSYNSYLVKGTDKVALIDTVDPTKEQELFDNLTELKVDRIDYVICNHAEQDHSGSIPAVLNKFKTAKVVTNRKCADMLKDLLLIPEEKFHIINDRDTLSLGGRTLEFIFAPWVHWPETMFTYLREDSILFTCDFLGSHLASSDLFATDAAKTANAAKRYYAEIMMPFRTTIRTNLDKIMGLKVDVVAPSHGPCHDRPAKIISSYRDWTSDQVKNEVVIPYISMHGSTKVMVDHLTGALMEKGIIVKPFNLSKTDIGELAMALVDAATIVIGTPTVLANPHPAALYVAALANMLRPKTRFVSIVMSYGWGGKTLEVLKGMLTNLKVELIDPVSVKGYPKASDMKALDVLAEQIAAKHRDCEFITK